MNKETAILGGGCFWCLEPIFLETKGVYKVESGYMGGNIENPSYEDICSGKTGHAEVIRIEFNPNIIQFQEILYIFWHVHDPTTLNRQGNDIGTQYRSVIFYDSDIQKMQAKKVKDKIEQEKLYRSAIVTEISPIDRFYKAEEYHQNYYLNNKFQPYCQIIISPKIEKFRKLFTKKRK